VYNDEKIKNMGRFIYRAQIGPVYFLNFTDADPQRNEKVKRHFTFSFLISHFSFLITFDHGAAVFLKT
jgi:hypothetical protein